jgi:hypothetical protein
MDKTAVVYAHLDEALKTPERITQRLNSVGITGMLDAMVAPEGLPVYAALLARNKLTMTPLHICSLGIPTTLRASDAITFISLTRTPGPMWSLSTT